MSVTIQPDVRTILVIDDDRNMRIGLTACLKRAGYQVMSTDNGMDGLYLAHEQHPDAIICDVLMPPPNGFEVREQLLDTPDTADTPFIFLTGYSSRDEVLRGFELGADDYITKPFQARALLARLEAVLDRVERTMRRGADDLQARMDNLRQEKAVIPEHSISPSLQAIVPTLETTLAAAFESLEQQKQFLLSAMHYSHRLRRMESDIELLGHLKLDSTPMMRPRLDIETDLRCVIEETAETWTARPWAHKQLSVHVDVEPGLTLHAPPVEFGRAVAHLVDNACKFSPAGGNIDIRLTANGKGGCSLTIADEGPGIPESLRSQVFDPGFQMNPNLAARACPGLGVGLTIARTVARSLGGDVRIQDSPIGCVVQLTIPPLSDATSQESRTLRPIAGVTA